MNTEASQDKTVSMTTGQRLRQAREQLGLSQQTVAERLCLKMSTVRDIEEDSVSADLASTFVRGYIRSYAKLVHLPEDELLPMLAKQAPLKMAKVAPMQSFSLGKRRKKRDGWLMSFTWLIVFVVIGLTGAWWWQNHKAQQEEIATMADQSSAQLSQNNDFGFGLSKRRVTLSTSGVVPALDKLGDMIDVALAISLHAPNDTIRDEIVPINRKYNIETFLSAVRRYLEKSNANQGRVTVEYVMLDHINDSTDDAHQLAEVLKDTPCKINLIPWNPFPGAPYGRSSNSRVDRFSKVLMEYGFTTIVRKTRGDDIDAACGQLAGEVIDRTKRTLKKKMAGEPINVRAV